MAKCRNPQCDYFQKTVPDGEFCPFCGESLSDAVQTESSSWNKDAVMSPPTHDPSPGWPQEPPRWDPQPVGTPPSYSPTSGGGYNWASEPAPSPIPQPPVPQPPVPQPSYSSGGGYNWSPEPTPQPPAPPTPAYSQGAYWSPEPSSPQPPVTPQPPPVTPQPPYPGSYGAGYQQSFDPPASPPPFQGRSPEPTPVVPSYSPGPGNWAPQNPAPPTPQGAPWPQAPGYGDEPPYSPPRQAPWPSSAPSGYSGDATIVETHPTPPRPLLSLIHTSGHKIGMYAEVAYLGRRGGSKKPNPELDLTGLPYAEHISRPHACINWDPNLGRYSITDTQSANGTYLNGQLLRPGQAYPISNGDQLDFGHQHLVKFTIAIA